MTIHLVANQRVRSTLSLPDLEDPAASEAAVGSYVRALKAAGMKPLGPADVVAWLQEEASLLADEAAPMLVPLAALRCALSGGTVECLGGGRGVRFSSARTFHEAHLFQALLIHHGGADELPILYPGIFRHELLPQERQP